MPAPNTLLCTVGTSLIYSNLSNLAKESQDSLILSALAQAYSENNWSEVASQLHRISPAERICGAEINSVADLFEQGRIERANLHLLHSDTDDGRIISEILQSYFQKDGWNVHSHCVTGLQDDNPRLFRTYGLRNLAKLFGKLTRDAGGIEFCAINATGGYKAQIAIAALMGQALGIPVYYKHERFDAIIPFPPMPVALDFSLWEKASGMFMALSRPNIENPHKYEDFSEDWDERFEPLVERIEIDGIEYLELSTTGQIFHETFLSRFQQSRTSNLPRDATQKEKQSPNLGHHGYGRASGPITRFLEKLTSEVPYIRFCYTTYWNPDLPQTTFFRKSADGVQGIYSNGTWCAKFRVLTTSDEAHIVPIIVADLNRWMDKANV